MLKRADFEWALYHFYKMYHEKNELRRIVKIDLSRTTTMICDLHTENGGDQGRKRGGFPETDERAKNYAVSASEVLVRLCN